MSIVLSLALSSVVLPSVDASFDMHVHATPIATVAAAADCPPAPVEPETKTPEESVEDGVDAEECGSEIERPQPKAIDPIPVIGDQPLDDII